MPVGRNAVKYWEFIFIFVRGRAVTGVRGKTKRGPVATGPRGIVTPKGFEPSS